jgi:hypothetical protein
VLFLDVMIWLSQGNLLGVSGGSATASLGRMTINFISISGIINSSYELSFQCNLGGRSVPVSGFPSGHTVFLQPCGTGHGGRLHALVVTSLRLSLSPSPVESPLFVQAVVAPLLISSLGRLFMRCYRG